MIPANLKKQILSQLAKAVPGYIESNLSKLSARTIVGLMEEGAETSTSSSIISFPFDITYTMFTSPDLFIRAITRKLNVSYDKAYNYLHNWLDYVPLKKGIQSYLIGKTLSEIVSPKLSLSYNGNKVIFNLAYFQTYFPYNKNIETSFYYLAKDKLQAILTETGYHLDWDDIQHVVALFMQKHPVETWQYINLTIAQYIDTIFAQLKKNRNELLTDPDSFIDLAYYILTSDEVTQKNLSDTLEKEIPPISAA